MSDPQRRKLPLARHRMQRSDFVRAYAEGRRAQGAQFAVVVRENGLEHTRVGLSVSKRHARLAVRRNRVRRILREAFRLVLPELPRGLDVVLIATAVGLQPRLAETRVELLALVARALRKKPRRAQDRPRDGRAGQAAGAP